MIGFQRHPESAHVLLRHFIDRNDAFLCGVGQFFDENVASAFMSDYERASCKIIGELYA